LSSITRAVAYLVDLPVEAVRSDAVQSFLKQETVFVEITTDDGAEGTGYSYTIGTGGSAVLALLRDYLLPRLPGQDARRVEAVTQTADDSGFGPSGKTAGVDVNTEWGAQNSENPGFAGFLPGFNANNHDLYKITLTATTQNGAPVGSVSVFADATVVPEPASVLLVGLGIGTFVLTTRKRRASHRT